MEPHQTSIDIVLCFVEFWLRGIMILIFKRNVAEKIVGKTRRLASGLKHFCAPRQQSFPTTTGGIVLHPMWTK